MLVQGQGGTGKSKLIAEITVTFEMFQSGDLLAKTATTGVAASLIGGQTLHSWACIPLNNHIGNASKSTRERREGNISGKRYLIVDECSMLTKDQLAMLSEILGVQCRGGEDSIDATVPFGGMSVVLFGDFHQFPPVGDPKNALYCSDSRTERQQLGRHLYEQFNKVVNLCEQIQITDEVWAGVLARLRVGMCDEVDLKLVRSLVLTSDTCAVPDFSSEPWSDAVLVTPRHSVRIAWNTAALEKYSVSSGHRIYVCYAEDTTGSERCELPIASRVAVAALRPKKTGDLHEVVLMVVGMKAMVMTNTATEADLANGTRGVIDDIIVDPRDRALATDADTGYTRLRHPPAMVIFKPYVSTFPRIAGFKEGCIPIFPTEVKFFCEVSKLLKVKVTCRQYAVTPAYAFTDYKSQGQTIEAVVIDLGKPPSGCLSPFSAYVALSRSRGRETIHQTRWESRTHSYTDWLRRQSRDRRPFGWDRLFRTDHVENGRVHCTILNR